MSRRSSASCKNYFRGLGVRRGDRMMLDARQMSPPLWENEFSAYEGGRVITPTTTLPDQWGVGRKDTGGAIRHIVADSDYAARFSEREPGMHANPPVGSSVARLAPL